MPSDVASLLFAMTIGMATLAIALPAVMQATNSPARRAKWGVVLQALGWVSLMASGLVAAGSWSDWLLSTIAMAGLSTGMALVESAFELWLGRSTPRYTPFAIAAIMPLGYALGFSSYAFRVGWANGWLALQLGVWAFALARRPSFPVGRWRWLMVISLLTQMTVTAWRGVLGAFFSESYPTFLAPHPVNLAFAITGNAANVVMVISILLAHRDEAARELQRLATTDGLTGVFNRRAWLAEAQTEISVSMRYGHPMAVVMIDLDHFKRINDTRGHDAGDRALQLVAQCMRKAARAGDLVGRYGGEEFCVSMSHADLEAAQAFDQRLRDSLRAQAPMLLGFEIGFSAGIAIRQDSPDTLDAMLKRADAALYAAKARGRSITLDAQSLVH